PRAEERPGRGVVGARAGGAGRAARRAGADRRQAAAAMRGRRGAPAAAPPSKGGAKESKPGEPGWAEAKAPRGGIASPEPGSPGLGSLAPPFEGGAARAAGAPIAAPAGVIHSSTPPEPRRGTAVDSCQANSPEDDAAIARRALADGDPHHAATHLAAALAADPLRDDWLDLL